MSKRTRGAAQRATQRRPGQRPAGNRPPTARAAAPASARPPSSLPAEQEVTDDVVQVRPDRAPSERRTAVPAMPARARARTTGVLAAKAATEYVYVAQDLRRITAVSALLFGIMFVLWILLEVVRVVRF